MLLEYSQELQLLYILTSVWVLHTPNAGLDMFFNFLNAESLKKLRKSKKFAEKFSKKMGLHQNTGWRFYSTKNILSVLWDLFIPIKRTPELFIPNLKSPVFPWSLQVTIFIESTMFVPHLNSPVFSSRQLPVNFWIWWFSNILNFWNILMM